MRLILTSILASIAIFLIYHVTLARVPDYWKLGGRAGSQYEMNVMRAEEFMYTPDTPRVVIAGSSVASRMETLPADWFNLGFSGDSTFTSLDIIDRSGKKPKYVFVEVNVLTRGLNQKLADEVADRMLRGVRTQFPGLLEANKPSHVLLRAMDPVSAKGFIIYPPGRVRQGQSITTQPMRNEDEPEVPPNMPAEMYHDLVRMQVQNAAAPIADRDITKILKQLGDYVQKLQARGIQIILFEVPEHPDVMTQPGFHALHQRIVETFPPAKYTWLPAARPEDYHTTDGVHMTTPGTVRYCRAMVDFVASLDVSQPAATRPAIDGN